MVFADATKYAVILFDPVIIGLAALASVPSRSSKEARRQAYRMLGYSASIGAVLLAAGGRTYLTGMMSTDSRSSKQHHFRHPCVPGLVGMGRRRCGSRSLRGHPAGE